VDAYVPQRSCLVALVANLDA